MENSLIPRREMEANQPTNPESGEGHNLPEETGTEHVISLSDSLEERFRALMDSDASVKEEDEGHKPLIGHVPILSGMETELKQYYFHPRIMSIGPVHHGKNDLEQGQQYKHQLTKLFIEGTFQYEKSFQSTQKLYSNIFNEIESFKECYDQQELLKKFSGDDQELAWMFFVDGCALFQFIRYYLIDWHQFYFMNIGNDQVDLMATDLMLSDNQLPLGVLNLVMGFGKEGGELYPNDDPVGREQSKKLRRSIFEFIEIIEIIYFGRWGKGVKADSRFIEIFELIYDRLRNNIKADSMPDQSFNKANHLLELIWMNFVKKEKDGSSYRTGSTSRHFRSVKDLQATGIRLEASHPSSSPRDIAFYRGILFRKLRIPRLLVNEQVKFLLFNLIAFEMHPNFTKDRVVTSYISFLNSLIETKEDVAELQVAGILFNNLPNDQEVVKTFRELTSSLKPYPDIFYDTRQELIRYFNDKNSVRTGKWLSEAMQVYFRSPWTTIAFISATFLLILTIIQTIFSVLAYQRRETICDFIPEEFMNGNCSEWVNSLSNAILNLRKND